MFYVLVLASVAAAFAAAITWIWIQDGRRYRALCAQVTFLRERNGALAASNAIEAAHRASAQRRLARPKNKAPQPADPARIAAE